MGHRQCRPSPGRDLGQPRPQPVLQLAGAFSAGGAKIQPPGLVFYHLVAQLGTQIGKSQPFPFAVTHFLEPGLDGRLAPRQQHRGFPGPAERARHPVVCR